MTRHTREHPCRVCGGHADLPRGRGVRCHGYLSNDGRYAHCVREEHAGELEPTPACTYAHRLDGPCRCGVMHGDPPTPIMRAPGPRLRRSSSELAREVWRNARPAAGTIVGTYLRSRGIVIAPPVSLRYAARCWYARGDYRPAMIAGVQDVPGRVVAVHRTYLAPDGSRRLDRRMLGPVRCGAVRLAEAGEKLAIAEGLETSLSVLQATGIPTWCALSASGLATLELPPAPIATRVVIVADGDRVGLEAAARAGDRFCREGRAVRIARPPAGLDANDLLRGAA